MDQDHNQDQTKRLIIRPFRDDATDTAAAFNILSNETVNQFLPWFPVQSALAARAMVHDTQQPRRHMSWYAVCLKTDDIPIGYVTVADTKSQDLGYGLLPAYWNQGIITEAAAKVIQLEWVYGRGWLTATHDVHNPASGRVMQKLGMIYQYTYQELTEPKHAYVNFRMYQINLAQKDAPIYEGYWAQSTVHYIEDL
ncbi:GNAT family N-acetyltransferase [Schleiferilactobacillus shenzhenensis]|uniref:N-acetyltransferase domain-containing protein n=1 Tax=Schleiferilactobacillus shenzhenensis LY-73 TaxID=1231336 RepID=U4TPQ2_9LACO|nr:GNAT family N-acetyltransferase [Schleiferilactobacillus shenzhenensis]ERL63858.1 hypothetical protein L248_2092 [Schleiferilactobacillus shenzhenensis LY-73]